VTALTMLAIDLAGYGLHRAFHGLPQLWRIHRIHHQSRFLTPLATFRQHPLEPALLNGVRGLAAGLTLGLLHSFLPNCTPVWTIAGMGAGFFAYMFTVNLHHAPIPVRFPRLLSAVLISPHIHHLHHSRAQGHHGKNFGVVFSFWDRVFGSYLDQDVGLDELEFGVED
jgi:sterol desaturase/sphingolipid hydroxylase (fatty acid hydroxylase superfamily)